MRPLSDMSIKTKLMLLAMLAVTTAMSVACTAFVANDARLIRQDMAQQVSALANVLGANTTAALKFMDTDAAEQLLASLRMQPLVTSAVLYDSDGNVFATYPPGRQEESLPAEMKVLRSQNSKMIACSPIVEDGETVGTIVVRGDLRLLHEQLLNYSYIVAVVLVVSFAAAYLLASRLQRVISGPISGLTAAAQRVSENSDYSVRVSRPGNDELGDLCAAFNHMLDQVEESSEALVLAHSDLEARVMQRTQQLSKTNAELNNEIAERQKTEEKLEQMHRELVESARRAGMAEVATGVLHNVGNVLNSVNISATMISNQLGASKVDQLAKVIDLIDEHQDDLGEFVTQDERGRQVPRFLRVLSNHLASDEQALLDEARSLISNIEHIKTIVSTQQSYANSGGHVETTDLAAIVEDAVRLNSASFGRHGIDVVRELEPLPEVLLDRQRVLQIVINLVKNAKESLVEREGQSKQLTLRTLKRDDRLILQVEDNGTGVSPENLTRIFSHGFTTKKSGHGFGLHSCANSATEMDGSLTVASDGPGRGARFTLDLPFRPAGVAV
ncbi:Sensor histidine kinase TmoS [Posidoniimonas corsicana]|uniref:histidine kinase n=1 Tax=Posidoniimonas corsicana TaxID=1938618 RepID=A0A5C5VJ76_9BACT|nr:ATP-binding protein [Posidoniimonas corsicana]TWT37939.1 Sensor histidine kinase TmoS [Posidoniimonas corsicana]